MAQESFGLLSFFQIVGQGLGHGVEGGGQGRDFRNFGIRSDAGRQISLPQAGRCRCQFLKLAPQPFAAEKPAADHGQANGQQKYSQTGQCLLAGHGVNLGFGHADKNVRVRLAVRGQTQLAKGNDARYAVRPIVRDQTFERGRSGCLENGWAYRLADCHGAGYGETKQANAGMVAGSDKGVLGKPHFPEELFVAVEFDRGEQQALNIAAFGQHGSGERKDGYRLKPPDQIFAHGKGFGMQSVAEMLVPGQIGSGLCPRAGDDVSCRIGQCDGREMRGGLEGVGKDL